MADDERLPALDLLQRAQRSQEAPQRGALLLKRGVDTAKGLWDWRYQVESAGPDAARTDCTLELLDYDGSPIATYNIKQAWPSKYTGVSMNAGSNEVAVEGITLAHEGFKRM